jgi:GntR family transcriptional regulator
MFGVAKQTHADLAARYRQHLTEVGRAPAPPEVADAFGLADGAELVVRRYLVRTQDAAVEMGASWLLPGDCSGTRLESFESFGKPLYQEVEDVTGRTYITATDTLSARLPTREEAELLQIRPDTPVLHLLHVAYDQEHRPIEVAQATWPGPMTTLVEEYRVPAPRAETDPGLYLE